MRKPSAAQAKVLERMKEGAVLRYRGAMMDYGRGERIPPEAYTYNAATRERVPVPL